MKVRATILILFAVLFGCRKDKNPNVILSGTLTDCPANNICTYSYFDSADFTNSNSVVHGNYRVFWYKTINTKVCYASPRFYFKTSLAINNFDITPNQVAAGQIVAYDDRCPCCALAGLTRIISGEVKGKRTDATDWLINASIVFGYTADNPIDTLVVNQYFTLEKIP